MTRTTHAQHDQIEAIGGVDLIGVGTRRGVHVVAEFAAGRAVRCSTRNVFRQEPEVVDQ